jgi:hypothetical protein
MLWCKEDGDYFLQSWRCAEQPQRQEARAQELIAAVRRRSLLGAMAGEGPGAGAVCSRTPLPNPLQLAHAPTSICMQT